MMSDLEAGARVYLRRYPKRGVGTVTGSECHWPRCQHADCVEVRWDDHWPNIGRNHDRSELDRAD